MKVRIRKYRTTADRNWWCVEVRQWWWPVWYTYDTAITTMEEAEAIAKIVKHPEIIEIN